MVLDVHDQIAGEARSKFVVLLADTLVPHPASRARGVLARRS